MFWGILVVQHTAMARDFLAELGVQRNQIRDHDILRFAWAFVADRHDVHQGRVNDGGFLERTFGDGQVGFTG